MRLVFLTVFCAARVYSQGQAEFSSATWHRWYRSGNLPWRVANFAASHLSISP